MRFIVSVIEAMTAKPALVRCAPCSIIWSTISEPLEVLPFAVLSG